MERANNNIDIRALAPVMDEIADQINLVALNVAIGAARAGKPAQRLSLLADDLRHLAEQATRSSEETATLLESGSGRKRQSSLGKSERTKTSECAREVLVASAKLQELTDQLGLSESLTKLTLQTEQLSAIIDKGPNTN